MTHKEAVDVLETIKEMYPKYEITKKKGNMLITQLKLMDYRLVMQNLATFVANHRYAPTIAEIAAYNTSENTYLQKMKQWQEEAAMVPSDKKEEFNTELLKLIQEKSAYECE